MSALTVEEVTQAIDSLIVAVRNTESAAGPSHDWRAADAEVARLRDGLIALAAGAAPPEGAPTWAEIRTALTDRITLCRSCPKLNEEDCFCCTRDRALISRIPKVENADGG